jgi:hypothetical protein
MSLLALAVMLAMLDPTWPGRGNLNAHGTLWFIAALCITATRYPSWMAESPPVAFIAPLSISAAYLWRSARANPLRLKYALAASVIGSALSKVVTVIVLVPLAVPDVGKHLMRRWTARRIALTSIALAATVAYAGIMLWTYLPRFLKFAYWGPISSPLFLRGQDAPILSWLAAAHDLGVIALAVAASRLRIWGLTLSAWIAVAACLVMPFLLYATLPAFMLALAVVLIEDPERFLRARRTFAVAGIMLLPYSLAAEPGGTLLAVTWVWTVASIVVAAFAAGTTLEMAQSAPAAPHRRYAAALLPALLLALLLPAMAAGAFHAGPREKPGFTPATCDIWLAVRAHTAADDLIFTDQVDATESRTGGWNDYALTARRQFFLVTWTSHWLRSDPAELAARLRENETVLTGAIRPGQLRLSRAYSDYYAVIPVKRSPPPGAVLIYANGAFALYRLQR